MTTLNVNGLLSKDGEALSFDVCFDAEATWDYVPVATAEKEDHRVGLLVILGDKRHGGIKESLRGGNDVK